LSEKSDVSIRKFDFSDVDGIVELLNTSGFETQSRFTSEWWKWKYELNPNGFWGEKGDIWVAEKDDKIVGHYAIIPEKVKIHSKVVSAAQSVDTATHPDYRRQRIFTTLAKKVYSDARDRYHFIFGFPSEMAYKGFIRLGWKNGFFPSEYVKILNYDQLSKRKFANDLVRWFGRSLLKISSNLNRASKALFIRNIKGNATEIHRLENFSEETDILWERARRNFRVVLERTSSFLNWRFSRHFGCYEFFAGRSVRENEPIGYMVIRKRENTLDIVDLMTLPDEQRAMLQLIDEAVKIGKDEGIDYARCWFPKWHKNAALLMKMGFIRTNQISRLIRARTTPLIVYDLTPIEALETSEWFYTLADADYH